MGDIFWHSPSNNIAIDINTVPADGRELSRTEYSELFERIGTRYGAGNGSTTFNVPSLLHKFAEGGTWSELGTYKEAGLPNLYGNFRISDNVVTNTTDTNHPYGTVIQYGGDPNAIHVFQTSHARCGVQSITTVKVMTYTANGGVEFNASRYNPIYGNSTTVQPNSILLLPLIIVKSNTLVTYCFKRTV